MCFPVTHWFVTLQGKKDYLDVVHKYLDLHGTVDNGAAIPNYVTNHGIVKGREVHTLLRQSKVCMSGAVALCVLVVCRSYKQNNLFFFLTKNSASANMILNYFQT